MPCQSFLKLGLVDEIRLSIIPILLGEGLRLFDNSGAEVRWHLENVVAYKTGIVELLYRLQIPGQGRPARSERAWLS